MVRNSIIAALVLVVAGVTIWGVVHLRQRPAVVNYPVPKEPPKKIAPVILRQPGLVRPAAQTQPVARVEAPKPPPIQPASQPAAGGLPLVYEPDGVIGEKAFQKSLVGLAIDHQRNILYAAGDQAVKGFDLGKANRLVRDFPLRHPPLSIGVDAVANVVYIGQADRAEAYDPEEKDPTKNRLAKIGDQALKQVTAVAACGGELLAADVGARLIRRYKREAPDEYTHVGDLPAANLELVPDAARVPDIGKRAMPAASLTLPNRTLDFAVDPAGQIVLAHPGPHRVETYSLAGKRLKMWGDYDPDDPKLFLGCCNPINVAAFPLAAIKRPGLKAAGTVGIVTAEKEKPRVKVYDAEGNLLAVIDAGNFDRTNTQMDLAVDDAGRIYVADTNRKVIRRFKLKG